MPDAKLVWKDELLDLDMMIKSDAELRILRYANTVVDDIGSQALAKAVAGVTEHELADFVRQAIAQAGGELSWMRPNRLTALERRRYVLHVDRGFVSRLFRRYCQELCCWRRRSGQAQPSQLPQSIHSCAGQSAPTPCVAAEQAAIFGCRYFGWPKRLISAAHGSGNARLPFPHSVTASA